MIDKVALFPKALELYAILGLAAVRVRWGPVLGVAVTSLAFGTATGAGAAGFKLCSGALDVRCIAHVAVVLHEALGKHTARGVKLGVEACADAVRNQIVLGRGDTEDRGHEQGDGGDRETHDGDGFDACRLWGGGDFFVVVVFEKSGGNERMIYRFLGLITRVCARYFYSALESTPIHPLRPHCPCCTYCLQ